MKVSSKIKDISGHRFGQLTVLEFSHKSNSRAYWHCICDCGEKTVSRGDSLRLGKANSCGHDRLKNAVQSTIKRCTKHGMHKSPTYSSWMAMKNRCTNNHKSSHIYSLLKICDRWAYSFENFLFDMGERPEGKTLDRIDNSLGYFKENCRWATPKEQGRNKRNNVIVNIDGVLKSATEWAEIYSINANTFLCRIRNGVPVEKAIIPPKKRVAEWSKV